MHKKYIEISLKYTICGKRRNIAVLPSANKNPLEKTLGQ